jgi:hypothetical protein
MTEFHILFAIGAIQNRKAYIDDQMIATRSEICCLRISELNFHSTITRQDRHIADIL